MQSLSCTSEQTQQQLAVNSKLHSHSKTQPPKMVFWP